jgi:hypothetical protein
LNLDQALQTLLQNDARQDARLDFLEKIQAEHREMMSMVHKMSVKMDGVSDQIRGFNNSISDLKSDIDDRLKSHGERLGYLDRKPGKKAEQMKDGIKMAIITGVVSILVTAIVTYLLISLGAYY